MSFTYWYWNKIISPQDIIKLNQKINHYVEDCEDRRAAHTTKITNVKTIQLGHIWDEIKPCINAAVTVNSFNFGMDIFEITPNEFATLNDYDGSEKGEYDWHVDGERDKPFDLKLTFIINLSETNYEGGEFQLIHQKNKITEFSQGGDAILFKSYHPHKVLPVTYGSRRTLVIFFKGPRLR